MIGQKCCPQGLVMYHRGCIHRLVTIDAMEGCKSQLIKCNVRGQTRGLGLFNNSICWFLSVLCLWLNYNGWGPLTRALGACSCSCHATIVQHACSFSDIAKFQSDVTYLRSKRARAPVSLSQENPGQPGREVSRRKRWLTQWVFKCQGFSLSPS